VPVTGFDRLRDSGFSEEDVQMFRNQFHEEASEDEEGSVRMREREEEWINSMASQNQQDESKRETLASYF